MKNIDAALVWKLTTNFAVITITKYLDNEVNRAESYEM